MARISVGIPARDEARHIEAAIRSVLAQSRPADEIGVFDNASTDGTDRLAAGLLSPDAVHHAPHDVGAAENFNRAARDCSGDYFAWLAADDLFQPDYLARTAHLLDTRPELDAAFVFVDYVDDTGAALYHDRNWQLNDPSPRRRIRCYLRRVRWCETYSLYRRGALLASPMFRAVYGGDVLLSWWFVLRGTIGVVEEPLLRKRVDDRDRGDAAMLQRLGGAAVPLRATPRAPRAALWRALWRDAARPGIPSAATRIARQELLLALTGRSWLQSFAADYVSIERQAQLKRALHRLRGGPWGRPASPR